MTPGAVVALLALDVEPRLAVGPVLPAQQSMRLARHNRGGQALGHVEGSDRQRQRVLACGATSMEILFGPDGVCPGLCKVVVL